MTRFEIYAPEQEPKQDSILQRFCRWICIPFRRRSHSYIEPIHKVVSRSSPSPPIAMVHMAPEHPFDDPTSSLYGARANRLPLNHPFNDPTSSLYRACENKPIVHQHHEPKEIRQQRGRYREARPQHPASHTVSQRTSPKSDEQVDTERSSIVPATREGVESPTYDAPLVNGKRRSRSKTEKNKTLPGALRAEPLPLTREYLESNEKRHSSGSWLIDDTAVAPTGSYLIENIPNAPRLHIRRWSNDSQTSVRPDARAQFARNYHRVRGHSNPRQRRSSDGCQNPRSRQSSATRQACSDPHARQSSADRQNAQASLPQNMRGGTLPSRTNVVPLRDDSERVLVHSKSRGFKVVRNLLSLDRLKDVQPRHVSSLEQIAAEQQRSEEEFANITAVIADGQRRTEIEVQRQYDSWPGPRSRHPPEYQRSDWL